MEFHKTLKCAIACATVLICSNCSNDEKMEIKLKNENLNQPLYVHPLSEITIDSSKLKSYWMHDGDKKLDISKLKLEIYQISKELSNVKYSKDLAKLIIETLNIETNLGKSNYLNKDHITKNYGLGQFVLSTAKYILKVQKQKNPDVYATLMKYYDHKLSLKDNVRRNVKFTIALQLEYYIMCDPNLNNHIGSVTARAKVWKKHYNTVKGAGTVDGYVAAVKTRLKNVNI